MLILMIYVIVSLIWGSTNALLRLGVVSIKPSSPPMSSSSSSSSIKSALLQITSLFLNYHFYIPYLLNQSGSFLFYYLLAKADSNVSMQVPIINALTTVFTFLFSYLLGERLRNTQQAVIGTVFVCVGVAVCSYERLGMLRE